MSTIGATKDDPAISKLENDDDDDAGKIKGLIGTSGVFIGHRQGACGGVFVSLIIVAKEYPGYF
jgi:hypothetical protein